MKYGQHLKDNIEPQYGPDPYLNYSRLDDLIRVLSDTNDLRYFTSFQYETKVYNSCIYIPDIFLTTKVQTRISAC